MSEQSSRRPYGAVTSLGDPPPEAPGASGFSDRRDAGRQLAALLEPYRGERPVVVGIPRGGVPVAAEVARALDAPLDITVVRKIGAPQNPEYAIGALAEGGVHVLSGRIAGAIGLSEGALRALLARAEHELEARLRCYRGAREPIDIAGRTVILVDDGLATGRSARAAVRSVRRRGAARVVLAVPVAAPTAVEMLREEADDVVCVATPNDLWSVGQWYQDFAPTADDEVTALLADLRSEASPPAGRSPIRRPPPGAGRSPIGRPPRRALAIPLDANVTLSGELSVPARARGIVAFAHGSGSSRLSPRNRAVAQALGDAGFATLLFDLLTPAEEVERTSVFDIPLLARRLVAASSWLGARVEAASLPLAYFGASTGAAAALMAAAQLGDRVRAVVSRGGRPDLARNLGAARAPTLLIVGGADHQVLALNREAQQRLRCPSELAVVPGATHLFEEPGALEQVSRLAIDWLDRHLADNHEIQGDSI
jgi:putative phosphoribosyl transferase